MPVLGITGGIGTGKSAFCRCLGRWLPGTLFDADAVAREVLDDPGVTREVLEAIGRDLIGREDGGIDRSRLREVVFEDAAQLRKLEAILHPLIRARWRGLAGGFQGKGEWLVVEIPLLFETGAASEFDTIAVVACSLATQRARIEQERGLPAQMAGRIIEAQQSLASKVSRAEHVIWSDSPLARLEEQAQIFAGYLLKCYG